MILIHEVITPSNALSFDKWKLHRADFVYCSATVFIYIHSFNIFIDIHAVHLNRVYDKAKVCTGGWGKPMIIYHMFLPIKLNQQI